jgi:peptidoglycan/LPS O-acetylase OafA/YrhL
MTGARTERSARRGDRDERTYGRFGYHPGLDGVRGLAVAAVFLFHAGSPLAPGGLLGVSVFFTLSGYLITRLLLDEGIRTAMLDLPSFWARRLRRLLPAALAAIALVLVLSVVASLQVDPASLRLDVLGALGYVANWRFLLAGNSYSQLFQAPSPLLHYWSLAIEEQFYLLLPLVVWLVLRRTHGARSFRLRLRTALLVGIGISLLTTLIAAGAGNYDFVYYSLPSRAGELLVGGVFATFAGVARIGDGRAPRWLTAVGFAALLAIGVLCTIPAPSDGWIGRGGLTAFAVISVTVIVAATPVGPLASLLALWPIRMLGIVSYGVYLYHWPIILWLSPDRTGLHGTELVLLQASVTLGVAVLSYRLLERPIRTRAVLQGSGARFAAPLGIAAMALCGFVVTSALSTPSNLDFAAAASAVNVGQAQAPAPAAPVQAAAGPSGPPTVAFFGDSSGLLTAKGFKRWAADGTHLRMVGGAAWYGCGIVREGEARFNGKIFDPSACGSLPAQWGEALDEARPEIAVIQVGPIEVDDHLLPGDSKWRAPGDPTYDTLLKQKMREAVDVFLARGVEPIWLTSPDIEPSKSTQPPNDDPSGDPARMTRFNQLLHEVQRQRPELRIIDLAHWMKIQPGGQFDPSLRPDGVHFDEDASASIVAPWLARAILDVSSAIPLPTSTCVAHLEIWGSRTEVRTRGVCR